MNIIKLNRHVVAVLLLTIGAIGCAFGQDTNSSVQVFAMPDSTTQFGYLQWAVPLLAPVLVMLIKTLTGWFEGKFSRNLVPYLCLGVAVALMALLDYGSQLKIPLWVAGPIAGAIGIGSRELLMKGLGLLGLRDTPGTKPESPAVTIQEKP